MKRSVLLLFVACLLFACENEDTIPRKRVLHSQLIGGKWNLYKNNVKLFDAAHKLIGETDEKDWDGLEFTSKTKVHYTTKWKYKRLNYSLTESDNKTYLSIEDYLEPGPYEIVKFKSTRMVLVYEEEFDLSKPPTGVFSKVITKEFRKQEDDSGE